MNRSHKLIVFVHLLNDYSGSPLVLSHAIAAISGNTCKKILYTSTSSQDGFLSGLEGVETRHFHYRWKANGWLRLFSFTFSQLLLFVQLLRFRRRDVLIYVNTLLPFGAGLAGRLMGKKVIYHLHETSMKPPLLKTFLRWVANHTADVVIYVSRYLEDTERLSGPRGVVVYNSLSPAFALRAESERRRVPVKRHRVLMLCSLKEYKGIREFLILAGRLPDVAFELVLNANPEEMRRWLARQQVPENCSVYPTQTDTHPFYQRSSIVINLSHPDKWVETFGMTILEAMAYGLPVIVPPVGGVTELVEDGVNGFYCDYRDLDAFMGYIDRLVKDEVFYRQCSEKALIKTKLFSASAFGQMIQLITNHE